MELGNNGQSVAQLLRKSIRSCLSRTYFSGTILHEDDLREARAKQRHVGLVIQLIRPFIAAAEVCHLVTMGSEATADDRIHSVQKPVGTVRSEPEC